MTRPPHRSVWSQRAWVSVSCLIVLVFTSCADQTPVRIGFIAGLSGPNSQIGVISRNAAELAVAQINEAGGVDGRPIELVVRDDHDSPDAAVDVVSELVDDGVRIIVGPFMSAMTPVVESHAGTDVLFMSPTISSSTLSGRDDNFLRIMPAATAQGYAILSEMEADGIGSAMVLFDGSNAGYADELARLIENEAAAYAISASVINVDGLDYSVIARRVASAAPDAIVLVTSGYRGAHIAQEVRELESEVRIYGSHWPATRDFIEQGGRAVEGVKVTNVLGAGSDAPEYLAFYDAYAERYGEVPLGIGSYSYEAIRVLARALERVRRPDPAELKEAILSIGEFAGLREPIVLDEYGDATRGTSMYVVRDGEFVAPPR